MARRVGVSGRDPETCLREFVQEALRQYGVVLPPKERAALLKGLEGFRAALEGGKFREAGQALAKLESNRKIQRHLSDVVGLGADVCSARAEFEAAAAQALEAARALEASGDLPAALREYRKAAEDFEKVSSVRQEALESAKRLGHALAPARK